MTILKTVTTTNEAEAGEWELEDVNFGRTWNLFPVLIDELGADVEFVGESSKERADHDARLREQVHVRQRYSPRV